MGKRSNFERIEKDYYRTIDVNAVLALKPHLPESFSFCEPCAGDGSLIDMIIDQAGGWCSHAYDIEPKCDFVMQGNALDIKNIQPDFIITNPPWSRPILHKLIEYLPTLAPTWLLFDADWMHTKQSAPYMAKCVKIVSVGRLKWIPDTTMSGKDNCAWYLFDANHSGPTVFVGRQHGP